MPTFSFGGWAFGPALSDVLDQIAMHAKCPHSSYQFNHLGSDAAGKRTRLAEFINRRVEEFLEALPRLGMTTTTQAVVSGTAAYNIPTATHGVSILKVWYSDTGSDSVNDLRELAFLSDAQISQLGNSDRNGDNTTDHPAYWGFNALRTQIQLYPAPSGSSTLVIEYRQEPTPITAANIASTSGVTIGEVPVRFINCIALAVASDVCLELESAEAQSRAAQLLQRSQAAMEKAQESMTKFVAAWHSGEAPAARRAMAFNRNSLFAGIRA